MALYPCSVDGARYRGASSAIYPAIVRGRDSERAHLRLCGPHFENLREYCREHLEEVVYDRPSDRQGGFGLCSLCGGDPDDRSAVFVTAYGQGEAEAQFFGELCASCVPKFRHDMLLAG